jgi:hypothetical protein
MAVSDPGIYANAPSSMVTPWWAVCADLGYPELDVIKYEDGEHAIIQYLRSPVIPSLTPWQVVLSKLRHIEMSPWVIKKWAEQLDLEKKHTWAELERKEAETLREIAYEEQRFADKSAIAYNSVIRNPDLMERVAKNGVQELTLRSISRQIPNHRFRKDSPKKEAV